MGDNTTINPGSAGDVIATDELTTLNGAGSTGVKVQRVKVGFGDDNDLRDVSTAFPLPVVAPALTKGTQGSTGHSVQQLKDAGRAIISHCTVIGGVAAVNAEATLSMVPTKDLASSAASDQITATTGKRKRLKSITVGFVQTGAAVLSARFALRGRASGTAIATDPIIMIIPVSSGPAVAQQGNEITVPVDIEISGTQALCLTQVCSGTGGNVFASVNGFEY